MEFVKAHGAGNDFVLIEDLDDAIAPTAAFVRTLCDRHFGVGGDGLIRIAPSEDADFFMDYWNADGAVAEMCGNGIRCLAKYVGDRGLAKTDEITVATRAGNKPIWLIRNDDGVVVRARVDMGPPVLERSLIPVAGEGDPLHVPLSVEGASFDVACVSMGNPHAVLFVDDLATVPFEQLGPTIETLPLFPAKTNVEFVQIMSSSEIRVRVWERGVGETLACGTGACATVVAAELRGFTGRAVSVHLPGGTLEVDWDAHSDHVYMTGPAEETFRGQLSPRIVELLGATTKG